jgi:hypothetical protein
MRKFLLILLVASLAYAQDLSELRQMLAVSQKRPVHAQVVEKLCTLKVSPQAFDYLMNDKDGQLAALSLGNTLIAVANNLGLGDVDALDRNNGYDGKSPLVADMIDSWKGKVSLTLVIPQTDPEEIKKGIYQLSGAPAVFQSTNYFLPRGGQAHITWTLVTKAPEVACKVSKDGNTYDVTVPVHATLSQDKLSELVKKGKAP